jgi:DNA-binding beta-propeller fold protein YncE
MAFIRILAVLWSCIAPISAQTLTAVVTTTLNAPLDAVADVQGNLYIADQNNRLVKMWTASTQTLAVLPAFTAQLVGSNPKGVAVDPLGTLIFATGAYVFLTPLMR